MNKSPFVIEICTENGDWDVGNPADYTRNPWVREGVLREYCGDGTKIPGIPHGWKLLLPESPGANYFVNCDDIQCLDAL